MLTHILMHVPRPIHMLIHIHMHMHAHAHAHTLCWKVGKTDSASVIVDDVQGECSGDWVASRSSSSEMSMHMHVRVGMRTDMRMAM